MSAKTLLVAICLILGRIDVVFSSESGEWNYGSMGPDEWFEKYPQCAGILQSPINIVSSSAVYNSKLSDILFINYDKILYWNATNNGHTIYIYQIGDTRIKPYIRGSDFNTSETLYLTQLHYHWGQNNYQGSEHHIDNRKFPLEVHLVHKSVSGKVAVVSFVFQISEQNNTDLNFLLKLVGEDIADNTFNMTYAALSKMLPNISSLHKDGYFRYMGSLTTPPCTEGVIWTVYRTRINISATQMENFYENVIHFNFRDVQDLNNRTLYSSVNLNPKPTIFTIIQSMWNQIMNYFSSLFRF